MNLLALAGLIGGAVGLVSGAIVLRRGLAAKKHWTKPVAVAPIISAPQSPSLPQMSAEVKKFMETNE